MVARRANAAKIRAAEVRQIMPLISGDCIAFRRGDGEPAAAKFLLFRLSATMTIY